MKDPNKRNLKAEIAIGSIALAGAALVANKSCDKPDQAPPIIYGNSSITDNDSFTDEGGSSFIGAPAPRQLSEAEENAVRWKSNEMFVNHGRANNWADDPKSYEDYIAQFRTEILKTADLTELVKAHEVYEKQAASRASFKEGERFQILDADPVTEPSSSPNIPPPAGSHEESLRRKETEKAASGNDNISR